MENERKAKKRMRCERCGKIVDEGAYGLCPDCWDEVHMKPRPSQRVDSE